MKIKSLKVVDISNIDTNEKFLLEKIGYITDKGLMTEYNRVFSMGTLGSFVEYSYIWGNNALVMAMPLGADDEEHEERILLFTKRHHIEYEGELIKEIGDFGEVLAEYLSE